MSLVIIDYTVQDCLSTYTVYTNANQYQIVMMLYGIVVGAYDSVLITITHGCVE